MNAVDFILDNMDALTVLHHYGFRHITETHDSIRACCEIHKGNNPTAFVWNKENNLWFCYTGDCYGGDVFTLVEKMENVDFITAVKKVANILGLHIESMKITNIQNRIINEQKKWIELQKRRSLNSGNRFAEEYSLPFTKYNDTDERFSRFSEDTLRHYNAKFCKLYPIEESMLYHKLVIPIIKDEKCVGVALRDVTGTFTPKWFFQPTGLKTGSLLYNFDTVLELCKNNEITEVILVEGIFDVWAYHEIGIDNVIAVFGSTLKEEQYKMLLRLPLNIVMSFDNDEAGIKCTKETARLFKNKTRLYNVNLPMGCDPSDCTKDQLREAYMMRTLAQE